MSTKNKREAAARARIGRDAARRSGLLPHSVSMQSASSTRSVSESNVSNLPPSDFHRDNTLDSDAVSDWDCGYDGGVSYDTSENETEAWTEDDEASEAESLCELEGDELEANFRVLMVALDEGTEFETLMAKKTAREWNKVESNRNLGYNGLSLRRKQEIAKKAKEGAATREAAKTS